MVETGNRGQEITPYITRGYRWFRIGVSGSESVVLYPYINPLPLIVVGGAGEGRGGITDIHTTTTSSTTPTQPETVAETLSFRRGVSLQQTRLCYKRLDVVRRFERITVPCSYSAVYIRPSKPLQYRTPYGHKTTPKTRGLIRSRSAVVRFPLGFGPVGIFRRY